MSRITGKIVRIFSDTMVAVNVGKDAGVSEGMVFEIKSRPVELWDDDGKSLGSVAFRKGRVRVSTVFEKFSLARSEIVTDYTGLFGGADFNKILATGLGAARHTKLSVRSEDINPLEGPGPVMVGDPVSSVEP